MVIWLICEGAGVAPGESISLLMTKIDIGHGQSVVKINLDETVSVVGPIGWDRKSVCVPFRLC